jgi:hypothetical protein
VGRQLVQLPLILELRVVDNVVLPIVAGEALLAMGAITGGLVSHARLHVPVPLVIVNRLVDSVAHSHVSDDSANRQLHDRARRALDGRIES